MICVSIGHCNPQEADVMARDYELVEFRLDTIPNVKASLKHLFGKHRAVATCRPDFGKERTDILLSAVGAGAAYVDFELEADEVWRTTCMKRARDCGTSIILSFHDMKQTPADEELNRWLDIGLESGADIVKLACYCQSYNDCLRLMNLASQQPKGRVVLGMGAFGIPSRVLGPLLGAPFTFAAPDGHDGTAPGQVPYSELKRLINVFGNQCNDG